jgi:photosystem II stability/assembly factor-like uncharacterized protein
VLEAAGKRIYGYGSDFVSREASVLVSSDGGRRWQGADSPEPLLSLAIDPRNCDHVVASGEGGSYSSIDGGRGWRRLSDDAGLLAWTASGGLVLVRLDGSVVRSNDGGRGWKASRDGGRSWRLRSRP